MRRLPIAYHTHSAVEWQLVLKKIALLSPPPFALMPSFVATYPLLNPSGVLHLAVQSGSAGHGAPSRPTPHCYLSSPDGCGLTRNSPTTELAGW